MVTLPLIYALQDASLNGHQQKIQHMLNGQTKKEEDIREVINWITSSYGIQRAMTDAHVYARKAREALYHFPVSPDRDILDELIDFVIARNR